MGGTRLARLRGSSPWSSSSLVRSSHGAIVSSVTANGSTALLSEPKTSRGPPRVAGYASPSQEAPRTLRSRGARCRGRAATTARHRIAGGQSPAACRRRGVERPLAAVGHVKDLFPVGGGSPPPQCRPQAARAEGRSPSKPGSDLQEKYQRKPMRGARVPAVPGATRVPCHLRRSHWSSPIPNVGWSSPR